MDPWIRKKYSRIHNTGYQYNRVPYRLYISNLSKGGKRGTQKAEYPKSVIHRSL
jgi:hypothetical protein